MSIYDVIFADGGWKRMTITFMSSQAFRLEHGGKSNADLALEMAGKKFPGRKIVAIKKTMTGEYIWQSQNYLYGGR